MTQSRRFIINRPFDMCYFTLLPGASSLLCNYNNMSTKKKQLYALSMTACSIRGSLLLCLLLITLFCAERICVYFYPPIYLFLNWSKLIIKLNTFTGPSIVSSV